MSDKKTVSAKEAELKAWEELATKQMKGRHPNDMTWDTPEGVPIKVLYTQADTERLTHNDTLPGMAPYVRALGQSVNMPAFQQQKNLMRFIAKI